MASVVRVPPYGFHAAGRYDDVNFILKNPDLFSSTALITVARAMGGDRLNKLLEERGAPAKTGSLVTADPPDHTRLRLLVKQGFSAQAITRLEPRIREIVSGYIDALLKNDEFNFHEELSREIPSEVIAELLGIDPERRAEFRRWSNAVVDSSDILDWSDEAGIEALVSARVEFYRFLVETVEDRRRNPRNDVISGLVLAKEEHDALSTDEIIDMVQLLLIAGNETTAYLISNGVTIWLQRPDVLDELRANPRLVHDFVEETLRFESPIMGVFRATTRELEISGETLPAGAMVLPMVISANRDDSHFGRPDVFDMHRKERQPVTFGLGPHYCLGAHLARLEANIAFDELVRRFPDVSLATDEIDWKHSLFFRGVESLHLRRA